MTNLIRARAIGSGWVGGPGLATFYFLGSPTPTVAEATEAAARVRAFFAAAAPVMWNTATWQPLGDCDVIDDLSGNLVGGASGVTPSAVVGTGGTNLAPPHNAGLIVLNTGFIVRGRRLVGRRFISPMSTGAITATGTPTAAAITAMAAAGQALRTTVVTSITSRVWSRPLFQNGVFVANGTSANHIGETARPKVASIRSRRD